MTAEQKLQHVLSELKRVAFPDQQTNPSDYWMEVEVRCDNATDEICDTDVFHKNLIKFIEE